MKKIILVEDDTAICDVIALALGANEYNVTTYETGNEILQHKAEVPDLFLLDKNISGVSGTDICRFIKATEPYKHVPVLILSASPDLERISKEAGADGSLAKPFSLKNLRQTIAQHLS